MNEKDQWFRDELERQRKCHKLAKAITSISIFILGLIFGMIIISINYECQPVSKLVLINAVWGIITIGSDCLAYQIQQKIKRMEEMID